MPLKETFGPTSEVAEGSPWTRVSHSPRDPIQYVDESGRLSPHQQEMSFLQNLMLYDSSEARLELEEKVTRSECREACARRAAWLMALLMAFALAGLGYAAILLDDFPQNKSQLIIRVFSALGLASFISLLAFGGFWLVSRGEVDEQRAECRRLVTKIIESRLGKPPIDSPERIVQAKSPADGVPCPASMTE